MRNPSKVMESLENLLLPIQDALITIESDEDGITSEFSPVIIVHRRTSVNSEISTNDLL